MRFFPLCLPKQYFTVVLPCAAVLALDKEFEDEIDSCGKIKVISIALTFVSVLCRKGAGISSSVRTPKERPTCSFSISQDYLDILSQREIRE